MRAIRAVFFAVFFLPSSAIAGVFFGADGLSPDCEGSPCANFVIVHPVGYTSAGIGGEIEIPICIRPGDAPFIRPAVEYAIDVWNALTPTTGNCINCSTAEEPPQSGLQVMRTTAVHELGHCAMALEHSNYQAPGSPVATNFSAGRDVDNYAAGVDNIKGSRDDVVVPNPSPPPPNAVMTHWFRLVDNDPVIIDTSVIDSTTYRVIWAQLPSGSLWPASANRFVSAALGASDDTQSVMHSISSRGMLYRGLSADDVNTVRYGMSGLDATAATGDDYTIRLTLVEDCDPDAEIEMRYSSNLPANSLGDCLADVVPIDPDPPPPIGNVHHALMPVMGFSRIIVRLSSSITWDAIYADGFESGDLSSWQ